MFIPDARPEERRLHVEGHVLELLDVFDKVKAAVPDSDMPEEHAILTLASVIAEQSYSPFLSAADLQDFEDELDATLTRFFEAHHPDSAAERAERRRAAKQ